MLSPQCLHERKREGRRGRPFAKAYKSCSARTTNVAALAVCTKHLLTTIHRHIVVVTIAETDSCSQGRS